MSLMQLKQKTQSIIFDLDGTLWDSRQAVASARNNVSDRLHLNFREFTAADVQKTMGLPMDQVYERAFPSLSPKQYAEVREALEPEICTVVLAGAAKLFPGVEEGLETLSQRLSLYLVSNCSVKYLQTYLEWSGHQQYFQDALCYGFNNLPKAENIRLIMKKNELTASTYVGDTKGDHEASNEAGVQYIHADYGFGEPLGECVRISEFAELKKLFF
jgi:phosphoglycolate phosphatase